MEGSDIEPTRDLTDPSPKDHSTPHQLRPNDLLGGRFVIVQFLARGGMGEVYEAEDRHLQGKHLALKLMRPEMAADESMRQRFEREVLLAREVVHRNVCPTYDLCRMDGPHGPVVFLTMKLLRGESLAARLRRGGRMPGATAMAIARQIADGLDAAHHAGVVHRDLKPGNVMLEGSTGDARVSLTDFGLSRLYDSDWTAGKSGWVIGTAGYIAPEVLEGRPATPASDIYALGIVLHEMLTGMLPARPKDGPVAMSPGLSPRWSRAVAGCLARDPADRFQSAGEVIACLNAAADPDAAPSQQSRLSRRTIFGICAGVAGVSVVGSYFAWPTIDTVLHPLPSRRFIALMTWPEQPEARLRPLLNGIMDVIATRLVRAEAYITDLLVIRPNDVAGTTVRQPAEAVHSLGANLVLAASLQSAAEGLVLILRLLDAATNRMIRERHISSTASQAGKLSDLGSAAAASMLQLPAAPLGPSDPEQLQRVSAAAYEAFSKAEDLVRRPNDDGLDQAIAEYQKALEADPNFALGYARLAVAYVRKFHNTRQTANLRLAENNSARALALNLNSAKAVFSQGLVDLYQGRTSIALDELAKAARMDPGNPEFLLHQAAAFGDLGKTKDEEQIYRQLKKNRPNFWPAYNELGWLLYSQGRLPEAAETFQEAAAVAPQVALPLANAGSMYLLLKRKKDAIEAFQKSVSIAPNELGYINLGNVAFEDHDYSKALQLYEKARDLNPQSHFTWRSIGDCYAVLGNRKQMLESYARAAEAMANNLKANPASGSDWMTLAFYEAKVGRQSQAEADMRTAEDRGAASVEAQFMKAQTLAVLGKKKDALRLVLACLDRGLSTVEVEYALDLDEIRRDSHYRRYITQLSNNAARREQ